MFAEILGYFEKLGFPLSHFPETEDCREMWQYEDPKILVQVVRGTNGRYEPSVFGSIDYGEESIDISFPEATWLEDGPPWIETHLGRGQKG